MNLLLLLLPPLLFITTTTSTATIPPGSSLYASNTSQTWSSPNNAFFLGFTRVDPTSYVISISTATGVPIWTTVNRTTSAAVVDSGGVFQFLSNGNLRLVNGSGATVWTSNTAKLGVTSASLDDTGNLVLAANTFAVWSSFENPTDTLVPSQNLTVNQTLRSGVYSFQLLRDGNITLTWNESVVYWKQGSSSLSASNVTSPTLRLQPNGILTLSDASSRRSENVAYANDYDVGADVVRFMRLGSDGNLRMYSGGTTAMTWAALADQCQVYGYCGNMGICSYMESSSSPICKCPSLNFEAVDVNDRRKGCKRKVEVENCAGNVTMLELKQTNFFTFQDQQIVTIGITACRGNCLSSTSCFASTSLSDTNAWCYMKNTPDFVSGYQGPVLHSTSFLKVCGPVQPKPSPLEQSGGDKKCWKLRVWAGGVVATISVMAASAGLFCFHTRICIAGQRGLRISLEQEGSGLFTEEFYLTEQQLR
ncbi:G-TYPE LECTIN S-RECEPTOR SERINE/THREONINE-PROTEIN KINASE [Salix viminalis]|uniref:non-specific serine/threonine protein kinase n=1 Tax=Salix viminalis TaxID=40686 RepID=A0A9Q0SAV6_SALVM|nr:G-TYPE LECTIN S-RECEPTOR SERINE/THREONINE-PROTEIN KINASE [Salix viminalis]